MISSHTALRQKLFGPVVPGRECGDCTACCTFLKIGTPELIKPAGVTCEHCRDRGCAIYAKRFPVCRGWHCLWKHIPVLPEEARPDRSGVLCGFEQQAVPENVFSRLSVRLIVIDRDKAESSDLFEAMMAMFKQGDLPVWLDAQDKQLRLVHPNSKTASAVLGVASSTSLSNEWQSGVRVIEDSQHESSSVV